MHIIIAVVRISKCPTHSMYQIPAQESIILCSDQKYEMTLKNTQCHISKIQTDNPGSVFFLILLPQKGRFNTR
mgnify:FL=1